MTENGRNEAAENRAVDMDTSDDHVSSRARSTGPQRKQKRKRKARNQREAAERMVKGEKRLTERVLD